MDANKIRSTYIDYFKDNKHAVIPSASLLPENDPTTLFTGSGMQPLIPYLMGETHPKGTRLVNSQKCFRAEDIEEVGDNRHTTFFEMLGNWSLGDYYKEEQLRWFFSFLVDKIKLDPTKIYVTVFAGDDRLGIPRDDESVLIWQKLFKEKDIEAKAVHIGSEQNGYETGMQGGRIFYYDAQKNWWSRSGPPEKMPIGEIGGPDSEVFYDFGTEHATHPEYKHKKPHPNSDSGQFLEIGNSVFIAYIKNPDGSFSALPNKNVDFGGGLERIAAAANNDPDIFKVDLLHNTVKDLEKLTNKKYSENTEAFRVVVDHLRGAVFMINDGVLPGNTDQSYFVRRLLRRAVRFADQIGIQSGELSKLAHSVINTYKGHYSTLETNLDKIVEAISKEESQFRKTLNRGLNKIEKIFNAEGGNGKQLVIYAKTLFDLYQTDGFPLELSVEIINNKQKDPVPDEVIEEFKILFKKHQELSRAGADKKFKGGLAEHSQQIVAYHTLTHLLLSSLRQVLGEHVHQAGSNITNERLRFDFNHPERLTEEEKQKIEDLVNEALSIGGKVHFEHMPKSDAQNSPDIEGSFWDRYPDEVKVYTITGTDGKIFSRELCGGPHVTNLSEIKGRFMIKKEESVASGIRRIKGVLQNETQ